MFVCVIFSSATKVPAPELNLIAFVPLKVVALAAEPPDLGSLIKATLLKSFCVAKSPELAVSAPSKEVLSIIKKAPNSSNGSEPCPPFGSAITSISAPDKLPPPAALISATLIYPKE